MAFLEDRRGKLLLLWWAWTVSAALIGIAPLLRALTHNPAVPRWLLVAVVAIMALTWVLLRRSPYALMLAIGMSASAIGIGASIGFLATAVGFGRALNYLLALKWGLGGIFLTALFIRQFRLEDKVVPEDPRFAQMSQDELVEWVDAEIASIDRSLKRQKIMIAVVAVLGLSLIIVSRMFK